MHTIEFIEIFFPLEKKEVDCRTSFEAKNGLVVDQGRGRVLSESNRQSSV